MYWNHRIVRKDGVYGIHEVDYNDDGDIICIVPNPEPVFANTSEVLYEVLAMMKDDITKNPKVLEYEEVRKAALELWDSEYGRKGREDHGPPLDEL